jgi:hypothetical protein
MPRLHATAAIGNNDMIEVNPAFFGLVENLICTRDVTQTTHRARSAERTHVNVSPFPTQRCGSLFRNLQSANIPWNVMDDRTKEAV